MGKQVYGIVNLEPKKAWHSSKPEPKKILDLLVEKIRILNQTDFDASIDCELTSRHDRFSLTNKGKQLKVVRYENGNQTKTKMVKNSENTIRTAKQILIDFGVNFERLV